MNLQHPTLYLLRGLPGAGKSTFGRSLLQAGLVQRLEEEDRYLIALVKHTELDQKAAAARCYGAVESHLAHGHSVAVANVAEEGREVARYQDLAEALNAKFVCLIVETRHEGPWELYPTQPRQALKDKFHIQL